MAKTDMADVADTTEGSDAPLIDLNDASIKKVIARAVCSANLCINIHLGHCRKSDG